MKRFIFLILVLSCSLFSMELKLGVGKQYVLDEDFENVPTNLMLEAAFPFTSSIYLGGGLHYNNYGEFSAELSERYLTEAVPGAELIGFERKMNGGGLYALAKIQPEFGDEAKIAPFVLAAAGLHFVVPTLKLEYSDSTYTRTVEEKDKPETVPFVMFSGGCAVYFGHIGVFLQASYIQTTPVEYDPLKIGSYEVAPGGEVDPSGMQIYIGIGIK